MPKDDQAAIVVFTSETRQSIVDKAGSWEWIINPKTVGRCHYLVCCRRLDWKNRSEGIAHRAAFLVGRIAGLKKLDGSENDRGQARYLIEISEYAELNLVEAWRKDLRNPVAYVTLSELRIELRRLKFKPVSSTQPIAKSGEGKKMSIADAKKALAATFGVKPEDVEITIRG